MFTVKGKRKRSSKADGMRRPGRGRPMKPPAELSISRDTANKMLRQSQEQPDMAQLLQDKPLSLIEQLPNELVQQIFFHCFEINLPRASLHVARALSTESVYTALILLAYFNDIKRRRPRNPVEKNWLLPAPYVRLELEERFRLQEDILSCRWLTLDRLKACIPALSRLTMMQAWHEERQAERHLLEQTPAQSRPELEAALSNATYRVHNRQLPTGSSMQLPQLEDVEGLIRHFCARTRFPVSADDQQGRRSEGLVTSDYLPRIITWSTVLKKSDKLGLRVIKDDRSERSTLLVGKLPDWLLKGAPWTNEKLKLLQFLRQSLRFESAQGVAWRPDVSHVAMFSGMIDAIEEKHELALLTLLEIHDSTFGGAPWPDGEETPLMPPNFHPLPVRVFHAATKAGEKSSEFMWMLIRGGLDAIPKDDDVLTAWGVRGKRNGDKIAEFLLDHMSDANSYDHHFQEYLFKYGGLNRSFSKSPSLPTTRRFAVELGYIEVPE